MHNKKPGLMNTNGFDYVNPSSLPTQMKLIGECKTCYHFELHA